MTSLWCQDIGLLKEQKLACDWKAVIVVANKKSGWSAIYLRKLRKYSLNQDYRAG